MGTPWGAAGWGSLPPRPAAVPKAAVVRPGRGREACCLSLTCLWSPALCAGGAGAAAQTLLPQRPHVACLLAPLQARRSRARRGSAASLLLRGRRQESRSLAPPPAFPCPPRCPPCCSPRCRWRILVHLGWTATEIGTRWGGRARRQPRPRSTAAALQGHHETGSKRLCDEIHPPACLPRLLPAPQGGGPAGAAPAHHLVLRLRGQRREHGGKAGLLRVLRALSLP